MALKSAVWQHADEVIARFIAGETQMGIGWAMGCSESVVRDILRANNVTIRRRGRSVGAIRLSDAGYAPPYPEDQYAPRSVCQFCQTRSDVGCKHNGAAISMGAW